MNVYLLGFTSMQQQLYVHEVVKHGDMIQVSILRVEEAWVSILRVEEAWKTLSPPCKNLQQILYSLILYINRLVRHEHLRVGWVIIKPFGTHSKTVNTYSITYHYYKNDLYQCSVFFLRVGQNVSRATVATDLPPENTFLKADDGSPIPKNSNNF